MQEEKVRRAFNVAHELAASCPADYCREAFNAVFHAMLTDEFYPVPHASRSESDEHAQPQ